MDTVTACDRLFPHVKVHGKSPPVISSFSMTLGELNVGAHTTTYLQSSFN